MIFFDITKKRDDPAHRHDVACDCGCGDLRPARPDELGVVERFSVKFQYLVCTVCNRQVEVPFWWEVMTGGDFYTGGTGK